MAKTTPEKFADAVMKELDQYVDGVALDVKDAVKVTSKAGQKTLRSSSRATFKGKGEYASGWKIQEEGDRLNPVAILHNTHPGLPHLLEYGHANRTGGRSHPDVKGRQHIKTVEEMMIRQFEELVTEAIKKP